MTITVARSLYLTAVWRVHPYSVS